MSYMTYVCTQGHKFHAPALLIKVKDSMNTLQVPVCPVCMDININPVEEPVVMPQGPTDADIADFVDVATPEEFQAKKEMGFVWYKEYSKFIRMVKHGVTEAEPLNARIEEHVIHDSLNGMKSLGFTLKLELANGEKVWFTGAKLLDPTELIKPEEGKEILCGVHCHVCEAYPDNPDIQGELCPNQAKAPAFTLEKIVLPTLPEETEKKQDETQP